MRSYYLVRNRLATKMKQDRDERVVSRLLIYYKMFTKHFPVSAFLLMIDDKKLDEIEIWGSHGGEVINVFAFELRADLFVGINISEKHIVSNQPWRWSQYIRPKRWYLTEIPTRRYNPEQQHQRWINWFFLLKFLIVGTRTLNEQTTSSRKDEWAFPVLNFLSGVWKNVNSDLSSERSFKEGGKSSKGQEKADSKGSQLS